MEMNSKNLGKLWDQWIGSKDMLIPKTLKRPINFLGSIEKHKGSFLRFVREHLKEEKKS